MFCHIYFNIDFELAFLIINVPLFFKEFFPRFYLFIYFERKGKRGEREGNINVWLPLVCPVLETWPTTQAWALTGNRTSSPLVHRPACNPLSHTNQGNLLFIFKLKQETVKGDHCKMKVILLSILIN